MTLRKKKVLPLYIMKTEKGCRYKILLNFRKERSGRIYFNLFGVRVRETSGKEGNITYHNPDRLAFNCLFHIQSNQ